jgi:hypothetical protein
MNTTVKTGKTLDSVVHYVAHSLVKGGVSKSPFQELESLLAVRLNPLKAKRNQNYIYSVHTKQ